MTGHPPQQRPEGKLLQDALEATGRSIRQVAADAGMSDARWRQLVKGYMTKGGHVAEEIAPAATLARMAAVLGITPEDLASTGRTDAASLLSHMATRSDYGADAVFDKDGTMHVFQIKSSSRNKDEIDLIVDSNMSAREKLLRIRQVLELRTLAQGEEAAERKKASAESAEAENGDAPEVSRG